MICMAASTRGSLQGASFRSPFHRKTSAGGVCLGELVKNPRLRRRVLRHRCCCLSFSQESVDQTRTGTKEDPGEHSGPDILDTKSSAQCEDAPLISALRTAAHQDIAHFRFPGHNLGNAAPAQLSQLVGMGPFVHDISQLDFSFSPEEPLLEARRKASELFGSSETWFLVGGTTCGVQASIMATCSPGETLILARNSHLSATSGMVFSGAIPKYIIPDHNPQWDLASGISPSQVERAILELVEEGKKAAAVLVTSPTYHGICSKLGDITEVCHSHGIPVIVDEAHGAHFKFHREFPSSALEQGADLSVHSTHKVLCSLTQSSMLHMSGNLVDRERVQRCLQTLQSTSPSWLLLASLDAARAHLGKNPDTIFNEAMDLATKAKNQITRIPGISVLGASSSIFSSFPDMDPLRLTVHVSELGLSGFKAADILAEEHQILSLLASSRTITLMINLGTRREDVQRLVSAVQHLSATLYQERRQHPCKVDDSVESEAPLSDIRTSLSPREAFFTKKRKVGILRSAGEVCGELICPYPPGYPVLSPGEIITEGTIKYLLDLKEKGAVITGAADEQLSFIFICEP